MNRTTKKEWLLLVVGSLLLALGVAWFALPSGIVAGGISGLAIVIYEVTKKVFGIGFPLSVTNLVLNIPLFIISIKWRGFAFAKKSLYSVILVSLFLSLGERIKSPIHVADDLFLSSVIYGALTGIGIGLVLRAGATTGGTDMLASIIKRKLVHMPVSTILFLIDAVIIVLGYFIFGAHKALYAIVTIAIGTYFINTLLAGMHFQSAAFIISKKAEEISQEIIKQLKRGNTGIKTRGMYTQNEQTMIFVVVSPKQLPTLRLIVQKIDADAFMIITDVKQALGEGFTKGYDTLTM